MAATSIISRREEVGRGVGVFSPEIPSRIAAVQRPSNSSEHDANVSFAYEGFEYPGIVTAAVTDVAARIEPAIRVVQRKGRRKSGDKRRDPGVLERSPPIYLEPRRRKRKRKAKEGRGQRRNKIRASRRSQVENAGPEKKIHTDVAGAWRRGQIHVPCRGCRRLPLQQRTGAQMIIRRHGNARPIARPDAPCMDILIPFSHPLPHSPILSNLFNPLSNNPRRIPPSSLPSRRFEAERMALVKPCFLPFEDLRPGALATLEARENPTMQG